MQPQRGERLRELESVNASVGGLGPAFSTGVGDTRSHRQDVRIQQERLKNIVRMTHEHSGQLSAEDGNAMLIELLAQLRIPEKSRATPRNLPDGPSGRSRESKHKDGEEDTERQRLVYTAIGNIFARTGNTAPKETWCAVVKMIRLVLECVATGKLEENAVASRFYAAVLRCAHLVLSDCKGPLEEQIPGLVGALQVFFTYGITNSSSTVGRGGQGSSTSRKPVAWEDATSRTHDRGAYRPPHLRGKHQVAKNNRLGIHDDFSGDYDLQGGKGGLSSDSEHSDSDALSYEGDRYRSSKVRTSAILTIQAVARACPKALHAHWVVLLPTQDVLQPRPYQKTLLTVLLYDPVVKSRMAAVSTLVVMLEGPTRSFLQVAEHREIARSKSFTTLSSSLGQMVTQLHIGLLNLIANEAHAGLVVGALKALALLTAASPYTRLPAELLPWTISTVHKRIRELFTSVDQSGTMCAAISCLGAALGSASSFAGTAAILTVEDPLDKFVSSQYLFQDLILYSQLSAYPAIRVEAFQALRSAVHAYASVVSSHWMALSKSIATAIKSGWSGPVEVANSYQRQYPLSNGNVQNSKLADDKVVHSAVKLLDECLRAASGYTGNDELQDEGHLHTPSPYLVAKPARPVAPPNFQISKLLSGQSDLASPLAALNRAGVKIWEETLDNHMTSLVSHPASMVRGAVLTCFAGLTSGVFCSLSHDKQLFVLDTLIYAAWKDDVPAVRSSACRAIGVVVGFPQVAESKESVERAVEVVVTSTSDPSVSVRITASWALANICDALRSNAKRNNEATSMSAYVMNLAESALKAAKDCDKVRANAVRALGNLARFVDFDDQRASSGPVEGRRWLDVMVQTLVSCVTTGNVKVQWNVCHALGNLFLNKTVHLSKTSWASSVYNILLLLLRDSPNFKIRIHAASALAVPADREDYGESFTDVVKALVHALEWTDSDRQETALAGFKYVRALADQLTATVVHIIGLSNPMDFLLLKDVLSKKSAFLLALFQFLFSSIENFNARDAYVDEAGIAERIAETSVSGSESGTEGKAYDEKPLPLPMSSGTGSHPISRIYWPLQQPSVLTDDAAIIADFRTEVRDSSLDYLDEIRKAAQAVADMYRFGDLVPMTECWEELLSKHGRAMAPD